MGTLEELVKPDTEKQEIEKQDIETPEKMDYHTPLYLQLREIIRSKIEEGEYMPGMAIPSENKLADMFGINRLTVRNAVDALVKEGILRRVQGKGVFVVGNKYEEVLEEHGGFISSMSINNAKRVSVKELVKGVRPAGNKYGNYFGIEPDASIFFLKHFMTIEDDPISVEEMFIPRDILPELEIVNSSVFSMKDIFAFYGVELSSMRQVLEVIDGMPKIRKMLDVPDGVALLMLSVDYFDKTGRPIECSRSFVRSDKSSFYIKMHE